MYVKRASIRSTIAESITSVAANDIGADADGATRQLCTIFIMTVLMMMG